MTEAIDLPGFDLPPLSEPEPPPPESGNAPPLDEPLEQPGPTTTTTRGNGRFRASTDDLRRRLGGPPLPDAGSRSAAAKSLAELIAGIVRIFARRLHERRTPGPPNGPTNDVWLATDDEAEAIAAPLARIAAANLPATIARVFIGGKAGQLGDGMAAAEAVRAYYRENKPREAIYHEALAAGVVDDQGAGEPAFYGGEPAAPTDGTELPTAPALLDQVAQMSGP